MGKLHNGHVGAGGAFCFCLLCLSGLYFRGCLLSRVSMRARSQFLLLMLVGSHCRLPVGHALIKGDFVDGWFILLDLLWHSSFKTACRLRHLPQRAAGR